MRDTRAIEEDLLGLLLLNPLLFHSESVNERLGIEDFSHAFTRCVWQAIEDTHDRGSFAMSLVESNARKVPEEIDPIGVYLATLLANAADTQESEPVAIGDLVESLSEAAKKRRLSDEAQTAVKHITDPDLSAEEAMSRIIEGFTRAIGGRSDRFSSSFTTLIKSAASRATDEDGPAATRGVSIGVEEIERLTGAWMPGDLVVLGGSSGSGKSALAMQIAWHVSASLPVQFYQLEMDGLSMAERHLASLSGVSMSRLRRGGLNAAEVDAVIDTSRAIEGHRLELRWRPRQTTAQIRASALGARGRHGRLGLIVVDHNKLVHVEGKVRDRIERIAIAMDDLKALSKEAECPVLMLSQMTREGMKRIVNGGGHALKDLRPTRYDLYGGGDMEEYADLILLAHRPEMVLPMVEPAASKVDQHDAWSEMMRAWEGKGEIIAEKVRHGSAGGKVVMKWNGARTRYEPLDVFEEWGGRS
ncbi:DnaB helicase C-terminal domain-containing protein [Acuticoccus sp. M5D2P5]|uniref:DnaB-like helicase C-terminal domain-containing protein n=1 Tax=Acuticoccus kalidii TaxID=2910977 RepID=UPI001F290E32|nr:DnaB-like helicase C-terminal domain-containing protein [Acuticoccus kalidii]MCF3935031.1 DnaB helicase C-terminal domain-containing protein [Acuticoccus kalidii]